MKKTDVETLAMTGGCRPLQTIDTNHKISYKTQSAYDKHTRKNTVCDIGMIG